MRRNIVLALMLAGLMVPRAGVGEPLGPTYPIVEPDLLQEIRQTLEAKAKSGELERLQREAVARAERSMRQPRPAQGLRTTREPRTFYFDPTITASRQIVGPDGDVLVQPGQRFNPLDRMPMRRHLVFFDARDEAQVVRAEALMAAAPAQSKPILVNGDYLALQKRWQRQVFYDQSGVLVRKLGIRQVPAVVLQEGSRLRIDEVRP